MFGLQIWEAIENNERYAHARLCITANSVDVTTSGIRVTVTGIDVTLNLINVNRTGNYVTRYERITNVMKTHRSDHLPLISIKNTYEILQ